jgi:hypothetical protein
MASLLTKKRWTVEGAWRHNGNPDSLVVLAENEAEAETEANRQGLVVSTVKREPPPWWADWLRRNRELAALLGLIGVFAAAAIGSQISEAIREDPAELAIKAQREESARIAAMSEEERAAHRAEMEAQTKARRERARLAKERLAERAEAMWLNAETDGRYKEGLYFVLGGTTAEVGVREGVVVVWEATFLNALESSRDVELRVSWVSATGERLFSKTTSFTMWQGTREVSGRALVPHEVHRRSAGVAFQVHE